MTTGLAVAYLNQFDVVVYNIQRPNKDGVLPDYTIDNYNRILAQKKATQKKGGKANEKTLTMLLKTVRSKEMTGSIASGGETQRN